MKNFSRFVKKNQLGMLKYEQKACKEVIKKLHLNGWDVCQDDIILDENWGWMLIACKQVDGFGVVLRRVKLCLLNDMSEFNKAVMLQTRLRKDLIEVIPYIVKSDKNRNLKVELLEPLFSLT